MMFSVALVGVDGAGKTSVARRLEETTSPVRYRYLYMGRSVLSSNAALPTSRLARSIRSRAGRSGRTVDRRGRIRLAASLLNRLAEAWWRQGLSAAYRRRGYVVVYDRHFLFESALELASSRGSERPFHRFEHWLLTHAYPKPDLVVFLDAPPEVALARKGESTERRLRTWRAALLEQGSRSPNFRRIDATRPFEDVLADVRVEIESFASTIASHGRVVAGGGS